MATGARSTCAMAWRGHMGASRVRYGCTALAMDSSLDLARDVYGSYITERNTDPNRAGDGQLD